MEENGDMYFCPSCGVKLVSDDNLCHHCGYRLVVGDVSSKVIESIQIPTPIEETDITPLTALDVPSDATRNVNSSLPTFRESEKIKVTEPSITSEKVLETKPAKRKSKVLYLIIIVILLMVACVSTVVMQKNVIISVGLLKGLWPEVQPQPLTVAVNKSFYVCYATYVKGGVKEIALTNVMTKKDAKNKEIFVKNDFNNKISKLYPKDFYKFAKPTVIKGNSTVEAAKKREEIKKQFEHDKYKFRFVIIY
ncbi:MAG: zinc ribbon domain-containing protein [Bacteroidota bacterium]